MSNKSENWKDEIVERCTCCDRVLNKKTLVHLELNCFTGKYSKDSVPPEESQGCFPFGQACARKVLKNGGEVAA